MIGLAVGRTKETISSSDELIMYVRDTGGSPPSRDDLSFRAAEDSDGESYARNIGTDSPDTFRGRLSESTHCFVVEYQGGLVHASWTTTAAAWTREIRGYLRPPQGDAYVYESFTRSEMRGRGVYPFALESICTVLFRDGIRRVWIAAEKHNIASQKAIAKAGFEEAFRLPHTRKLGRLKLGEPRGPESATAHVFIREA